MDKSELQDQTQETIAKWIKANTEHRQWYICPKCSYQAPRFRDEWVGLTEEEMLEAENGCSYMDAFELTLYAEKIEAKLKEKNCG